VGRELKNVDIRGRWARLLKWRPTGLVIAMNKLEAAMIVNHMARLCLNHKGESNFKEERSNPNFWYNANIRK
jgi:hypothetical protein